MLRYFMLVCCWDYYWWYW